MSKAIISDFLEGDTGMIGLEEEARARGIENPTTKMWVRCYVLLSLKMGMRGMRKGEVEMIF